MPGSDNGRAPAIALGTLDALQPGRAILPAHTPAIILVHAGAVPVGRVTIAAGNAITAEAIAAGLSDALVGATLHAGLSTLLARGVPDGPVDVAQALNALTLPLPQPMQGPPITVAVCTRDRERQLERAIASIVGSLGTDDELLVVDNASRGDLSHLVSRYPAVRLVREDRPGLDWARNRAVVESRGDVIAFTDDDCVMEPSTLPALRSAFSLNPDVDAVTGLVEPLVLDTEAQVLCDRYLANERWYARQWVIAPPSTSVARDVGNVGRYGTGASLAVRRRLFDRIGVFDAALGAGSLCRAGDDMEFFFRLLKSGALLLREPRVTVRHDHRLELRELEAQFEAWSGGFACAVERSMLAFPEERIPYAVLLARIAVLYHARRAVMHPQLRPIALAELRGIVGARGRYRDARRMADDTMRTIPSPARDASPSDARPRAAPPTPRTGQLALDLASAVTALQVDPQCTSVSIAVSRSGTSLGTVTIKTVDGRAGADRICDAITSQCAPSLLGTSWPDAIARTRRTLTASLRGVPA